MRKTADGRASGAFVRSAVFSRSSAGRSVARATAAARQCVNARRTQEAGWAEGPSVIDTTAASRNGVTAQSLPRPVVRHKPDSTFVAPGPQAPGPFGAGGAGGATKIRTCRGRTRSRSPTAGWSSS